MVRATIIIPLSAKAKAEQLGKQVDVNAAEIFLGQAGPAGGTWGDPPTHMFCGWTLTDDQYAAISTRMGANTVNRPGVVVMGETNEALASVGLKAF